MHSHCRCDNCEELLFPAVREDDEERQDWVDEDYVMAKGWYVVKFVDQETKEDRAVDLCCPRCVTIWAGVRDESKKT